MLEMLSITGPIFTTIGLGFLAARIGLFTKIELQVIGRFVINFALPALLFKSLSEREINEIFNLSYLLAYTIGSLTVLGLGYLWSRRVTGLGHSASTFSVMGMSCSNSGFIGYPILLLSMPSIAGVAFALNLLVEQLVMLPLLLAMAEYQPGASQKWLQVMTLSLSRLIRNPLILALMAGCCVSLMGWRLPGVVVATVSMFAQTCGALALFIVGGTLFGLPLRGMGRRVAPVVIGKLIGHPMAVLLAHLLLSIMGIPGADPDLRAAAVLTAAVPMLSTYTIFAQAYGEDEATAQSMLVATVASFFTLSGLMYLLL